MATAYLGGLDEMEAVVYSRQLECVKSAFATEVEEFRLACNRLSSAQPKAVFSVCDVLREMGR